MGFWLLQLGGHKIVLSTYNIFTVARTIRINEVTILEHKQPGSCACVPSEWRKKCLVMNLDLLLELDFLPSVSHVSR